MKIRRPEKGEGGALVELMLALDEETKFMMLEPGERKTSAEEQERAIEGFQDSDSRVMFVAEDEHGLAGFVVGVGSTANRNKHSMVCIIGVLQRAGGQGLGFRLMDAMETWAREHQFTRIGLTVMAHNERARKLYVARGFEVEGTKRNSLRVDGEYVDELYMSKVWEL